MRINYNTLKQINTESLTPLGDGSLHCYYIIQSAVERLCREENITDIEKNLLLELNIITMDVSDEKNIVEPFKLIMGDDRS
jgi:hypothetical protein